MNIFKNTEIPTIITIINDISKFCWSLISLKKIIIIIIMINENKNIRHVLYSKLKKSTI